MLRKVSRKTIISVAAVIFVLLAVVATVAIVKNLNSDEDPYRQPEVSDTSDNSSSNSDKNIEGGTDGNQADPEESEEGNSSESALDPDTVSTIDIEPMNISISYVKGVGGFEFEVLRTLRGAKYVEFRNSELIGTKCTDDKGTFASILADPLDDEGAAISKKVVVDGTTYGLSLATEACTSDPENLRVYQSSFSDAFGLLKKLD